MHTLQAIAAQLLWHATQRSEANRLALFETGGIKELCAIVATGSPQARYACTHSIIHMHIYSKCVYVCMYAQM
jgi:hypothetical protein